MTIHTKLFLAISGALAVSLLLGAWLWWTATQVRDAVDRGRFAHAITQATLARTVLRDEYFLHHEARARVQWYLKTAHLDQLLAKAAAIFREPPEQGFVEDMRRHFEGTKTFFAEIVALEDRSGQAGGGGRRELEDHLIGQIFVAAQQLTLLSFQLGDSSQTRVLQTQWRATAIVAFALLLFTAMTTGLLTWVGLAVVRPLTNLRAGAEAIARGDLAYRVALPGRPPLLPATSTEHEKSPPVDELGALAVAFNHMAEELTTFYTKLEQQVAERTDELARSNADLEQFAYVASHDLQEPLRAVAGCVQLLQQRYKDQLDGRGHALIQHAVEGASRMQSFIQDLLSYSRVGTRGQSFEAVDCAAVLESALASLSVSIRESGAVITHGPLPKIAADRTQLTQVIQNLVSNALKFRGQHPPTVHIDAEQDNGAWRFAVCDNGIGIEPRYVERIFGIFQRLHTRREYPGTGIGLAICKRIVERHGGRIWVSSEPGQGATFFFTIPHGR